MGIFADQSMKKYSKMEYDKKIKLLTEDNL